MGKVRYAIVLVLAVCYFLPKPDCLFYPEWPGHLLHHFYHANVFHFAVNALAVWTVFDPRTRPEKWLLPVAFVIASVSYCVAVKPTIGFSNVLFAVAGLRSPSFKSAWWRSRNALVFIGMMLLMFFLPMFSATTHLVSFTIGVGIAALVRLNKSLDDDTRRAKGGR